MPTSIAFGGLTATISDAFDNFPTQYDCQDAYHGCMPSFVFSIAGQVRFRAALDHMLTCNKQMCMSLRKKVKDGMHVKLQWLFQEDALLGCVHVQPFLYGSKNPVDIRMQRRFLPVASHLAQCPHDSCSRLRRAMLLTIRDLVSPNAR
ncbi:MAG: hypothetical protein HYR90_04360 [Candidatus Andersenbacteria bacterium]|nr:hypothetical protein [Candidatus Andersenbacteria bacterium]MBI3250629.1 hypothetical protein [Candidatus Andersenbacteria bacterium]